MPNGSMKQEGAEPSASVGGAEGGVGQAARGRNPLRGGADSCQSLCACPPPLVLALQPRGGGGRGGGDKMAQGAE